MKRLFKYLIIIILTACYLQAALEVNAGPITNTFGDEYDTYVQADDQVSFHNQKIEQSLDFAILPGFIVSDPPTRLLGTSSNEARTFCYAFCNCKLYISYCALLI